GAYSTRQRIVDRSFDLRRIRHRHGGHCAANAPKLSANFPAMIVLPPQFVVGGRIVALVFVLLNVTGDAATAENEPATATFTLTPLRGEQRTGAFAELTDSVVRMQDDAEYPVSGLYSID